MCLYFVLTLFLCENKVQIIIFAQYVHLRKRRDSHLFLQKERLCKNCAVFCAGGVLLYSAFGSIFLTVRNLSQAQLFSLQKWYFLKEVYLFKNIFVLGMLI